MQRSLYKLFLAPLSVLLLASFALAPMAEARGGGGGLGGGGDRAGGGRDVQVNNGQRDVRNTSINNVNVNRNVNVDVDRRGDGWNDNYHPVATVVVTAAVVGSVVRSVPPNCSPYNYNGMVYQQCGSSWYQRQYVGNDVQYVVVNRPY
ncbi:MAG: hypothetical protein V5B44_13015 [Candidatus Accumulibacter necessarius]|jgi:hypothetical protein|uniref:hypothetical protein n=1 Tax=Candidatus Accumulibacter necessarius TaxID=2954386 RepID=UPI002FC3B837